MTSETKSPQRRGPLGIVTSVKWVRHVADARGDVGADGYQFLPGALAESDLQRLRDGITESVEKVADEARVRDGEGRLRMVYGPHLASPAVDDIARKAIWVRPISQALQDDVYLYQSKLTVNPSHSEAGWGWHFDFGPWRQRDAVPEPLLISALVFLDDIGVDSGGLSVIEGSHRLDGTALVELIGKLQDPDSSDDGGCSVVSPVGPAGSVLLLHALTAHGSPPNVSGANRRLLIFTYNACGNLPRAHSPEWLCARDARPLIADL